MSPLPGDILLTKMNMRADGSDVAAGRSVGEHNPDGKSLYEKEDYTVRFIVHQWRLIRMRQSKSIFVQKIVL